MTGQKNRFKTTEKLWDLDDKQLKTPKHDAMVLWLMDVDHLYGDLNFVEHIPQTIQTPRTKKEMEIVSEKLESELPIMSSSTFIAGYVDVAVLVKYKGFGLNNTTAHLIEVKPTIDSFGAVLRQIKSYRKFGQRSFRHVKCYLFTLDDRFDAQFKSQGIIVLHPPNGVTIQDMMRKYGLK